MSNLALNAAAILLLAFILRVSDASSSVFVVQVGNVNACASSKNVALSQITAICSNGTNYCSEGDTVIVSVSDAYLSVKGSYGPCSWTLVKEQHVDLCLAAVNEDGKSCPQDGSYTMEAAEVKLDSGFTDYLDQNVTFTFEFEDSTGGELGCTSASVMLSLPAESSAQDMSYWYKYGSAQSEVAVTQMKAEQVTSAIVEQLATRSWVYISMIAAFVGIVVLALYIRFHVQVQPKLDINYDDKTMPFSAA